MFTLNPDAVWSGANPLAELEAAWDPERMDGLLLVAPLESVKGRAGGADFALDSEGRLRRAREGVVYLGAQILQTEGLFNIRTRCSR